MTFLQHLQTTASHWWGVLSAPAVVAAYIQRPHPSVSALVDHVIGLIKTKGHPPMPDITVGSPSVVSSLLNPLEQALSPVVENAIGKIPALAKFEALVASNPCLLTEEADVITLLADFLKGNTSAIAPDLKAALLAAPIPAPIDSFIASDPLVDLAAALALKLISIKHAPATAA